MASTRGVLSISIPYGSIKRAALLVVLLLWKSFQFLMVRLKVISSVVFEFFILLFQFLMVRLKDARRRHKSAIY